MWLYRMMPVISKLATHGYYRLTCGGDAPPHDGPVLIVANHSNSLIDPALVVVAAHRTVRFMTKAPLYNHPLIGWLVRAVGSVPVYRQMDDPKLVSQNFDSFRDVHKAIAEGHAVGIFPEGISHSASRLQPLKTGAARIALGAASQLGHAFPIVPMGLVFRDLRTFRSSARVIIGDSCVWDDLADRGCDDKEAVRELTRRIAASMRRVTLNLHDWSDEQIVRCAERVWQAEFGSTAEPLAEMERLQATTDALARLRLGKSAEWRRVAHELRGHDRMLSRLGFTPLTLKVRVTNDAAVNWVLQRLPILLLVPLAVIGGILFWIPREITALVAAKLAKSEGEDTIPTFRVLGAAVFFPIWFALIGGLVGYRNGAWIGFVTAASLPLIAFAALASSETGRLSIEAARRFVVRRLQRKRVAKMRARQVELAEKLKNLFYARPAE
jgi:glycerol-3-phosphate O-acyltransferase/dihydroxyacetone phosphate acyltransferase